MFRYRIWLVVLLILILNLYPKNSSAQGECRHCVKPLMSLMGEVGSDLDYLNYLVNPSRLNAIWMDQLDKIDQSVSDLNSTMKSTSSHLGSAKYKLSLVLPPDADLSADNMPSRIEDLIMLYNDHAQNSVDTFRITSQVESIVGHTQLLNDLCHKVEASFNRYQNQTSNEFAKEASSNSGLYDAMIGTHKNLANDLRSIATEGVVVHKLQELDMRTSLVSIMRKMVKVVELLDKSGVGNGPHKATAIWPSNSDDEMWLLA